MVFITRGRRSDDLFVLSFGENEKMYDDWAALLSSLIERLEDGRHVLADSEIHITEFPDGSNVVNGKNPQSYRPIVEAEA